MHHRACTQSLLPQSVPLSLRDVATAHRHRPMTSHHEPSLSTSHPTQQHAACRTKTPDAVRLQYRRPHDPNPQISRARPRRDTRGMPRLSTYVLTGMRTTVVPLSTRPKPTDASARQSSPRRRSTARRAQEGTRVPPPRRPPPRPASARTTPTAGARHNQPPPHPTPYRPRHAPRTHAHSQTAARRRPHPADSSRHPVPTTTNTQDNDICKP